jgi:hypothetical protein
LDRWKLSQNKQATRITAQESSKPKKNITALYNLSRTHGLVQQETSGNLVPVLGGKNLAARKSKEKEIGQHAGARKTQATNGDFPAEEQSTRSKT